MSEKKLPRTHWGKAVLSCFANLYVTKAVQEAAPIVKSGIDRLNRHFSCEAAY